MKKLIYIVEDDEAIREILELFFSDEDTEVKTFPNAGSFCKAMTAPTPDLYLLDINLPDGNGLELAKKITANQKSVHVPILLMSAHLRNQDISGVTGVREFIQKPFDLDYIKDRVTQYLYTA